MSVHVSSTCAHHQEVKIVLHSLWYHHTYRWPSRAQISQPVHETATFRCDDTRGCVIQFWPPEDEYMCSKHVEAWNKLIVKHNFVLQVGQLLRCAVSKTSNSCLQLTLTLFSFCTFPRNVIVYFLPLQGQNPLQPTRMTVWWMQLW